MRISAAPTIATAATIAPIALTSLVFASLVFASLVAAPAFAQQSAADCADIEDDRERLECYDRVFSGARDADETAADTRAREQRGESSRASGRSAAGNESGRNASGRSDRSARTASRDRRCGPESGAESPEDVFGMEKKVLELGGDEMTSTAVGQYDFWEKGQRIELENGQVWEITNSTGMYHKASNPRVTIEKGLFSSFYLHIDGVSKSLKVRRLR